MEIFYSKDELAEVAEQILNFSKEKTFLFNGPMGVGKTTLIKELCKVLGVTENISSPTFGIVNEYKGSSDTIYHFDFYRLNVPEEALDFGFEDYLNTDSYVFMEWPEKIEKYLPDNGVRIEIYKIGEQKRKLILSKL